MKKIYFDQDGTLAEFRFVPLFKLYVSGYFLFLKPLENIVRAMKLLSEMPETEVYILTSVLSDHPTAREEKLMWLRRHAPFIPEDHIVFVPCGCSKADYVEFPEEAVLVDDYGVNLETWPGKRVKVSRDARDMQEELKKHEFCINPEMSPEKIIEQIL